MKTPSYIYRVTQKCVVFPKLLWKNFSFLDGRFWLGMFVRSKWAVKQQCLTVFDIFPRTYACLQLKVYTGKKFGLILHPFKRGISMS